MPETGSALLFSVLVTTYNHAAFLFEALTSVAEQTEREFELVVVDDGSTDETSGLLGPWMDRFARAHGYPVRLSRIQNGGQSAALEHGFRFCSGRYICLLDSDDRWRPDKLQRVRGAIGASPGAGMIVHPLEIIDQAGRSMGIRRPRAARLSQGDLRDQMLRTGRHVAPPTSGVVIRADLFARLLPMPTRAFSFGADAYLTFGASFWAPVHAIEEPLGDYRLHAGGQYIQRMLSPEGLRRSVESQMAIVRHFGLPDAVRHNSFFARNSFALAKLAHPRGAQIAAFQALASATARDSSFTVWQRAMLLGFWSVCLVAPRPAFRRLWRTFQLKQAGLDRLPAPAPGI